MCGITGVYYFNSGEKPLEDEVKKSIKTLHKRGPDRNDFFIHKNVALGHSRLSIIDLSEAANQPFTDNSGQYILVFNGEFYNFKEYRKVLIEKGYTFRSNSDTEVLLNLYIDEGPVFLNKINGFFALAIYNKKDGSLFIARDRMGIKPLLIYKDDKKLIFASEMKALFEYNIPKKIDQTSLFQYFQFNYIPPDASILENVKKLQPGNFIIVNGNTVTEKKYYEIPVEEKNTYTSNYAEAKTKLVELLYNAVKKRMISDVPLGAFLSGGIDSSVIVAIASQFTDKLNTFSIGFKDQPYFDETHYANLVAKKYKTNHTVFSLTNNDLFDSLNEVLNYLDEPFADSSAIAVNLLSKHTRKKVTVALSGDGADELFAGYNKHRAHFIADNKQFGQNLIKGINPLINIIPQSRGGKIPNLIRQLNKLGKGLKLSPKERYVLWCSILDEHAVKELLLSSYDSNLYKQRNSRLTQFIDENRGINSVLHSDLITVLQGDMLRKVDAMSMANSLEVRTPFLDHELVNFVTSLPSEFKIDKKTQKKILRESFKSFLPPDLHNRPKQGFEVPLLQWFRTELNSSINKEWLNDDFIKEQNIFNIKKIKQIKKRIISSNPGDIQATVWALIVFQHWWKKNFV
ncbi:MAG: asparagine synthase (glutamine-hydrolyzing) [Chlorobi bacterium]|nr:asparagine synthase (glutamine-hydrolyzing) [Chlorobiota bacterium]